MRAMRLTASAVLGFALAGNAQVDTVNITAKPDSE